MSNDKFIFNEKIIYFIQSLLLAVFYCVMYFSKNIFGYYGVYKFFLFSPLIIFFFIKHVFQPRGIMVNGSSSLKLTIAICMSSAISALIFFMTNVYSR